MDWVKREYGLGKARVWTGLIIKRESMMRLKSEYGLCKERLDG